MQCPFLIHAGSFIYVYHCGALFFGKQAVFALRTGVIGVYIAGMFQFEVVLPACPPLITKAVQFPQFSFLPLERFFKNCLYLKHSCNSVLVVIAHILLTDNSDLLSTWKAWLRKVRHKQAVSKAVGPLASTKEILCYQAGNVHQ